MQIQLSAQNNVRVSYRPVTVVMSVNASSLLEQRENTLQSHMPAKEPLV